MRLLIADVARVLSVHPRTLRIWEAEGLLLPARRGGQRRYSEADIELAHFIHHLSARGVSLAGIALLLDLGARLGLSPSEIDPSYDPKTGLALVVINS